MMSLIFNLLLEEQKLLNLGFFMFQILVELNLNIKDLLISDKMASLC